jgi:4-amino-4-deoxy-L-arabinose transferase-like glycosyltransferase
VVGASIRLAYNEVTVNSTPIQADAANYVRYAENLVNFGVFSKDRRNVPPVPDAYWAPGYPAFLAGLLLLSDSYNLVPYRTILNAQCLLGILSILLTWLIGRELLPGYWPLIPTCLVALSPHLIANGQNLLTEPLFGFLILCSLYFFILGVKRVRSLLLLLSGIGLALAWLVNPVSLFMAPILAVLVCTSVPVVSRNFKILAVLMLTVPLLVIAAGWSVRTATQVPEGSPTSSGRLITNLVIGMHSNYHEMWRKNKRNPNNPATLDGARIKGSYAVFAEVLVERVIADPIGMLHWYAIQKPAMLWSWTVQIGWRDIYIYPIRTSLYFQSNLASLSYTLMKIGHAPLLIFALIGLIIVWAPVSGGRIVASSIYAVLVYTSAVYLATQSDPRYSFPLRYEMYLTGTWCAWQLFVFLQGLGNRIFHR